MYSEISQIWYVAFASKTWRHSKSYKINYIQFTQAGSSKYIFKRFDVPYKFVNMFIY